MVPAFTIFPHELTIVDANVRDLSRLNTLLEKEQFNFIYHLAAQAIVSEAAINPIETFCDNITGTWNILEAARLQRLKNSALRGLIVASSDKAYGDQNQLPYLETAPLEGRYPYDVSKSCADLLTQSYFHSYKLPVCVVRCGNLYGAGDLNFSRLIPATIKSLLQGEPPQIRSDGTPLRDYIYVKDAAHAYFAIASAMVSDPAVVGEAFNIGDDNALSVSQVVTHLRVAMGCEGLTPIICDNAHLEIKDQFLNAEKVKE